MVSENVIRFRNWHTFRKVMKEAYKEGGKDGASKDIDEEKRQKE